MLEWKIQVKLDAPGVPCQAFVFGARWSQSEEANSALFLKIMTPLKIYREINNEITQLRSLKLWNREMLTA